MERAIVIKVKQLDNGSFQSFVILGKDNDGNKDEIVYRSFVQFSEKQAISIALDKAAEHVGYLITM